VRPYRQLSTSLARTAASLMSMSLVAVSVVYPPITGMPLVPPVDGIRPRSGKAIGGQGTNATAPMMAYAHSETNVLLPQGAR
jgi:hypothetical protein